MLRRSKIQWRVSWKDETKEHPFRYQARDFDTKAEAEAFAETAPGKPEPVQIEIGSLSL